MKNEIDLIIEKINEIEALMLEVIEVMRDLLPPEYSSDIYDLVEEYKDKGERNEQKKL